MTSFFRNIRDFFFGPRLEGSFTYSFDELPTGLDRVRDANFLEFYGWTTNFNDEKGYISIRAKNQRLFLTPGDKLVYDEYSNGLIKIRYESGNRYMEWDND